MPVSEIGSVGMFVYQWILVISNGERMMRCLAIVLCSGVASTVGTQETMYGLFGPTGAQLLELDKANGNWINSYNVTGQEALFGGLAYDPVGDRLFSIDGFNDSNPDRLFEIDPATGAGMVIGPTGENWNFRMLHRDPTTGTLYGARDSVLYTMDTSTGEATRVAQITGPSLDQLTALAINSRGQAYGTDVQGVGLFRIDLATGAAIHLGDLGGNWMNDLAFDSGDVLYAAERFVGVSTIDIGSAQKSLVFSGSFYVGLAFAFESASCYPDCDGSTSLDVFDFLCFQDAFATMAPYADCDNSSTFDIFDFLCFQDEFITGCP